MKLPVKYKCSKVNFASLSDNPVTIFYLLKEDGVKEFLPPTDDVEELLLKEGSVIIMKSVVFHRGHPLKKAILHLSLQRNVPPIIIYGFDGSGHIEGNFVILEENFTHTLKIRKVSGSSYEDNKKKKRKIIRK